MVCLQVNIFPPQIFPLVALYCKSLKVTRKSFSSSPSRVVDIFAPPHFVVVPPAMMKIREF